MQAPLVSAASITIEAPVPEAWAVISDVAGWPAWYPPGNGHTTVTIRESLAGPLLPLLYRPSQLQAGHQQWLTALKTALER